jgi:hypothetical protein
VDEKYNAFKDLLTRLVRVPKREIDQQENQYQESRKDDQPAKPGRIVPISSHRRVG